MITTYESFLLKNYLRGPKDDGITDDEIEWFINNDIISYKFNSKTGLIDILQEVNLKQKIISKLPNIRFGVIHGNFRCDENNLTSLEGGPTVVKGLFNCAYNKLTSLEHMPLLIEGSFYCHRNQLTSLEHCPKSLKKSFGCSDNKLTSLEYCPQNLESFDCGNNELTSLDHCPKIVDGFFGNFDFSGNQKIDKIEDYPLCKMKALTTNKYPFFKEIFNLVNENPEIFEPIRYDKVKFHQMVMRLQPSLIQYYETIHPPAKKTIL